MKKNRCQTCNQLHKRTHPQNALYWTLLHIAAAKLKPSGVSYSAESYHMYYKSKFLGCDDVAMPNGKVVVVPRSTASLDVAEFSDFYTQVEADLAERGVYLELAA